MEHVERTGKSPNLTGVLVRMIISGVIFFPLCAGADVPLNGHWRGRLSHHPGTCAYPGLTRPRKIDAEVKVDADGCQSDSATDDILCAASLTGGKPEMYGTYEVFRKRLKVYAAFPADKTGMVHGERLILHYRKNLKRQRARYAIAYFYRGQVVCTARYSGRLKRLTN